MNHWQQDIAQRVPRIFKFAGSAPGAAIKALQLTQAAVFNGPWQVIEIRTDGSGLRQLTGEQPDVGSYDGPIHLDEITVYGQ